MLLVSADEEDDTLESNKTHRRAVPFVSLEDGTRESSDGLSCSSLLLVTRKKVAFELNSTWRTRNAYAAVHGTDGVIQDHSLSKRCAIYPRRRDRCYDVASVSRGCVQSYETASVGTI